MDGRFSEPVDWMAAALAFAVWAAHFSLVWAASSAFPGAPAARWIALGATMLAGGVLAWLWRFRPRRGPDAIARLATALAGAAVLFGTLPAIVG